MFRLALRRSVLGLGATGTAAGLLVASKAYNEPRYIKEEDVKRDINYITEEEAGLKEPQAYNPETGEINWDCPCLGGMAHGPCGSEFKEAFSCFVYSTADPKGVDCIPKFKLMQDCFRRHPEDYREQLELDEEEETAAQPAAAVEVTETVEPIPTDQGSGALPEVKDTVEVVVPEPEQAPVNEPASGDKEQAENLESKVQTVKSAVEDASSEVADSLRKGEDVATQVKSDLMKSSGVSKD